MENNEEKNKIRRVPYVGGEPVPGTLVEMLHRPETMETLFAIYKDGEVRYAPSFTVRANEVLVPYRADNNLIKNKIVLFPSCALEYETVEVLASDIKEFIHRYVTVTA